jgi:hypothetical protein
MIERYGYGCALRAFRWPQAQADAAERRDRHADFHWNAAHRAVEHYALAAKLDLARLPVCSAILC